jgi:hypothetical protein
MARRSRSVMIRAGLMAAGVLAVLVLAGAQEPPPFRKGLWAFTRTVEGTGQPKSTHQPDRGHASGA